MPGTSFEVLNGPNWAIYIIADDLYPLIVNNAWNDAEAYEKIKYLLEYRKGSSDIVNKGFSNNITPLQAAIEKGNIAVVRLLLQHGATLPSDALALAARSHVNPIIQNQLIKLLIELGAGKDPNMNARALLAYYESRHESALLDNTSIYVNTLDILSDLSIAWSYCDAAGASIMQKFFYEDSILLPMMLKKGGKADQIFIGPYINLAYENEDSWNEIQQKSSQLANMMISTISKESRKQALLEEICEMGITSRVRSEAAIEVTKINSPPILLSKEKKQSASTTSSNVSTSSSTMFSTSTSTTTTGTTPSASPRPFKPLSIKDQISEKLNLLFNLKCTFWDSSIGLSIGMPYGISQEQLQACAALLKDRHIKVTIKPEKTFSAELKIENETVQSLNEKLDNSPQNKNIVVAAQAKVHT